MGRQWPKEMPVLCLGCNKNMGPADEDEDYWAWCDDCKDEAYDNDEAEGNPAQRYAEDK